MDSRKVELSEVITDIAAGPFGSNLKVACFVPEGFPIIDGANLKGLKITDNLTKFVTEEKARSLSRSIARRGEMVVTISGTLGQIAYIPENSAFPEYLCSQRQFRVAFDTDKVYVPFLVYYFHTRNGRSKILAFANQTGVPALSQPTKNFKRIVIDLPDIVTQKRIAKCAELMTSKIELNSRINDYLLELIEAVFRSWFIGENALYPTSRLPMSEIALISAGGDKPAVCQQTPSAECSVPIYSNGTDNEGLYGYTDAAKIIEPSVTVSARGTIGFTCLRYQPYYPIVRLISATPKEKVTAEYLYLWLRGTVVTGVGTTQQQLTVPMFKNYEVNVPDAGSLDAFMKIATPLFALIDANKSEMAELAELRDALLPKLMSGEIDISRVEL